MYLYVHILVLWYYCDIDAFLTVGYNWKYFEKWGFKIGLQDVPLKGGDSIGGPHSDTKTTQWLLYRHMIRSSDWWFCQPFSVLWGMYWFVTFFSKEETEVKGSLPYFFPGVYLRAWIEAQVYPIV